MSSKIRKYFIIVMLVLFFSFLHLFNEPSILKAESIILPKDGQSFSQYMVKSKNDRILTCIINARLLPKIHESFLTYLNDLASEGYGIIVHGRNANCSSQNIRNLLKKDFNEYGIEGAFLIGNLPYAIYECNDRKRHKCKAPFAIDYYYMDLTGEWFDKDKNNILDGHKDANHDPEIYVGRLRADNIGENEVNVLNKYFERNHKYRNGSFHLPKKVTVLFAHNVQEAQQVNSVYNSNDILKKTKLCGRGFLNELKKNSSELCIIGSHSSPDQHSFPSPHSKIDTNQIKSINKKFHFYIMHCCSVGDFTHDNYMGGAYLLVNTKALYVIAVTKPSGTKYFNKYFLSDFLNSDQSVGMAIKNFDSLYGNDDIVNSDEVGFHILGDPTLKFGKHIKNSFNGDKIKAPPLSTKCQYEKGFDMRVLLHVAHDGDKEYLTNAKSFAGTTGQSKSIEGIQILKIKVPNGYPELQPSDIQIKGHFGYKGDQPWKSGNQFNGSRGKRQTLQKIAFKISGSKSKYFGIRYAGHSGMVGDLDCKADGAWLGISGCGDDYALQALKVQVYPK